MNLFIVSVLFISAMINTIFFFGKLFVWGVHFISKYENKMTRKQINLYCLIMLIGIVEWSILYIDFLSRLN